ncbi:flagellar hook protein FlgE [Sodalis sp. dw_96]|uniref:flagellar hook protein FlgE n=1 Tax=Sodalis sp. dw_96 TaxID=2719794 RepID=UPI001BD5C7C4|nr:flagellar hook protein FlgE [Sodalis sp. dw_96]
MGFAQGVSGLNAASSNLDVIGNNIANSETSGFKAGTVSFADIYAGSQVGLGVQVTGVTQDFSDGSVNSTDNGLNVAISNSGFFRAVDASGTVYYTRDGDFQLDDNRNLLTSTGMNVTGYPVSGTPPTVQQGATPVNLSIPLTGMSATATTTATMALDLDSDSADIDTTATPFDATDSSTYSFSEPLTTYDSLGNPHNISLYFTKTADNTWDVKAVDGSDPTTPTPVQDLGTLKFNTNGTLDTITSTTGGISTINMASVDGSAAATFTLNFAGSQQQYNSASSVSAQNATGYPAGDLTKYTINDDGTITGTYSNGQSQLLGQIVLANFANPQGLTSDGNNVWSATSSSGPAVLGTAGTGNFGTMTSGALEGSNVNLSNELVDLIVAQRDYQSNAQTIKAQDTIMQTLVSMS